MNTQVNVRMPKVLFDSAKEYAESNGYGNVQDFIRETVREKLFETDITQEEINLALALKKLADDKNLYGSKEDLQRILREE